MAILRLVTVDSASGRRRLRTATERAPKRDIPGLARLAADMIATMHAANGIGLAAPQVGRGERIAVLAHADGDFAILNPRIVRRSWRKERGEEGCLSIPGVYGTVDRARAITVEYVALDGAPVRRTVRGLLARVFQHEIDHLDGLLFIDRMVALTQGTPPEHAYAKGHPRR